MSKFISGAVSWVFGIICLIILGVKIWALNDLAWRFAENTIGITKWAVLECLSFLFLLAAVSILSVILCRYILKHFTKLKTYINSKNPFILTVVIFGVSMIVRLLAVLLYQCDFTNHEDMGNAYSFASQIANKGAIVENASYAAKYGRYVNFALLFAPAFKLFGTSIFTVAITLSFLFSFSYVAWFDVLRRKVSKSAAFFASLMLCVMLNEVCLVNLFLHETVLYFCLTAFVWMVSVAVPKANSLSIRTALYTLACVFLAIGAGCNPMGYVVIIAFCLTGVYKLFTKKVSLKSVMRFCICVLILVGVVFATSSVFSAMRGEIIDKTATEDLYRRSEVPYGWALYVGGNLETRGQWSWKDFSSFYLEGKGLSDDELYSYQTDLLDQRYSQYRTNPLRYGELLANKVKVTYKWNHYQYRFSLKYSESDINIGAIHSVLEYFISIPALFMMAFVSMGAFGKKRKSDLLTIFLKAFICGLFLILLIVETSAKYVSCIWALFVIILALQWKTMSNNVETIQTFRVKKLQGGQ